jgi:hypothetical protein
MENEMLLLVGEKALAENCPETITPSVIGEQHALKDENLISKVLSCGPHKKSQLLFAKAA